MVGRRVLGVVLAVAGCGTRSASAHGQVVTVTRDGARQSVTRMSGLPGGGGLAGASFTSTRTGWAVIITGKCARFKSDCTQTSALDATASALPGLAGGAVASSPVLAGGRGGGWQVTRVRR